MTLSKPKGYPTPPPGEDPVEWYREIKKIPAGYTEAEWIEALHNAKLAHVLRKVRGAALKSQGSTRGR